MRRTPIIAAAVCALVACGQPAGKAASGDGAPAEAAAQSADAAQTAEAAPRVSTTPCESSQDFASVGRTETFYAYSDNDPLAATGIAVDAAPGAATCTGREFDVSCQVRGPTALVVTIQDSVMWRIPAGRTATLTNRGLDLTCFLNEPS